MRTKPITLLFTILMIALLSSCIEDSGRKGKAIVKDFSAQGGSGVGCGSADFILLPDAASCVSSCDTELEHQATAQEIADAIIIDPGLSDIINDSAGACIANSSQVARPTNKVFIKNDYCACNGNKTDIINDCMAFCSTKNDASPTLYVNTTLGEEILLNSDLGNLFNWCNKEIPDNLTGPSCKLEVFDGNGIQDLDITLRSGSNSFTANISTLALNTTYVAKLVEKGSGSNAESKTFQFRRIPQDSGPPNNAGPLKIQPISQYTCVTRAGTQNANDSIFTNAARLHFYFASNEAPPSQPPGNPFLFCHDIEVHGTNDSPLYDRLELIPQHYAMWDVSDVRMADQDGDGKADINKIIQDRLLNDFGITQTINMFGVLTWPNNPGDGTAPNLGIYMSPIIDQNGKAFCPKNEHYNSSDKLFNILKEVVGVETEALYLSIKEPELLSNDAGQVVLAPDDILMIREGLLKSIWFYYENNQHFVPDEITATQKTIRFYWPADPVNPYIKKDSQKIYTVRRPDQISLGSAQTGLNTSIKPADKRFACIPSVQ